MKENGKKLYKTISDDIIQKIKSGKLSAGDKLPRTTDLVKTYGVSKVTIEKALKTLKDMNVVYSVKKAGTFVNGKKNAGQKVFALIITYDSGDQLKIIKAAEVTALINNCFIEVCLTYGDAAKEAEQLKQALKSNYDGVMVYPVKGYDNLGLYTEFSIKKIPLIFLDRRVDGIRAPLITPDNYRGAELAVKYLAENGHKNIGFSYVLPYAPTTEKERFEGFVKSMTDSGLKVDAKSVNFIRHARKKVNAEEFAKNVRSGKINLTAVVCVNDHHAKALIKAFEEAGLNVPDDLSVVGFDGAFIGGELDLTSVVQNFTALGETGVKYLIDLIGGKPLENTVYIPVEFHNGKTAKRWVNCPKAAAFNTVPRADILPSLCRNNPPAY